MKRAAIVGAGLGGLATAIRLAHAGYMVTVLEKNANVGGKLNIVRSNGYTFDTGPSLLTMPFVLDDLFTAVGKNREAYCELVPVDPICKYYFSDGASIHAWHQVERFEREVAQLNVRDAASVLHFLEHGKRIYNAASGPFMYQPFGSLTLRGLLDNVRYVPAITRIDAFRSLNAAVEQYFEDPRVRQLFNRFATYNGSSPYLAPATLAIIPFIEFHFGGWYVRGGMYELARTLLRVAEEFGVTVKTSATVEKIVVKNRVAQGVIVAGGEFVEANCVICNADALYAREHLLGESRPVEVEPSLAGFVLLLGVRQQYPQLGHHTIFFSGDYETEFDAMVCRHLPADDPTIYVANTSLSDSSHAPEGSSNLFVLVNAPALAYADGARPVADWESEKVAYRNLIVKKLEAYGLRGLNRSIEFEQIITPQDFEQTYNAFRGSIYGTSSNSRMAAFLRPANKSRTTRNLYFVGGSSHPGGGIPLVMLSAKIVAELVVGHGR